MPKNLAIMDTRASTEAFIQAQSIEYQEYVAKSRDLKSTIQHQQSLLNQRVIPKVYRPKLLRTTNSHLTEEFDEKYARLFTEHLNKVLTSNIINLELQRAAVTSIITQTERHLCSSSLSQDDIKTIYYKFLSNNNIHNHTAIPELQSKLSEIPPQNTSPSHIRKRRRQKRKNNSPHPEAIKAKKTSNSFLSQGPAKPHPPPWQYTT